MIWFGSVLLSSYFEKELTYEQAAEFKNNYPLYVEKARAHTLKHASGQENKQTMKHTLKSEADDVVEKKQKMTGGTTGTKNSKFNRLLKKKKSE